MITYGLLCLVAFLCGYLCGAYRTNKPLPGVSYDEWNRLFDEKIALQRKLDQISQIPPEPPPQVEEPPKEPVLEVPEVVIEPEVTSFFETTNEIEKPEVEHLPEIPTIDEIASYLNEIPKVKKPSFADGWERVFKKVEKAPEPMRNRKLSGSVSPISSRNVNA